MVIAYDREGVQIFLRYGKVMNNIWQSLRRKIDEKPNLEAALRKLEEETGLMVEPEDLKFLFIDPNYNCDIYTLKYIQTLNLT